MFNFIVYPIKVGRQVTISLTFYSFIIQFFFFLKRYFNVLAFANNFKTEKSLGLWKLYFKYNI